MRPLGALVGLIFGVGAIAGVIWASRYAPWIKQEKYVTRWDEWEQKSQAETKRQAEQKTKLEKTEKKNLDELEKNRPPISKQPPFPKIAPSERVYEFGKMAIGEEQKHTFRIKNIGEAPLLLSKGPTTCKCTIGSLSKKDVAVGGTADIELSWTPREVSNSFAQTATIWTNDPDLPEINFKVIGKVARRFIVSPADTWNAGPVSDVQDGEVEGIVGSEIDPDFKVTSVEPTDPEHVKVAVLPLTRREAMQEGLRGGRKFKVTINRGIPQGHFRSRLKIHTSIDGGKTLDVQVTAVRQGPIIFLPPVGVALWNTETSLLDMGRFKASVGHKVTLPAIVYGMKDPLKLVSFQADPNFVKVSIQPHPEINSGTDHKGIYIVFEVPAGSPPVTRITPDPAHITVTTNHPSLKELKFSIEFVSY